MGQKEFGQEKGDRLWLRYIGHHWKSLCLLLVSALLFFLVFLAYRLEWEAVWYAAVLCLMVWIVAALLDLYRYQSRHQQMRRLASPEQGFAKQQSFGEGALQASVLPDIRLLPKPRNLVEKDYQALIEALLEERQRVFWEYDRKKQERTDYETMWAHQIKTPIAAMRLLLQEQDTAEFRELSAELFQVEQYVEMILTYMRLDSPSHDFVFKRCALDEMVRQAVRKYAAQFVRRRVMLMRKDTGAVIVTDEKWLVFVLEQLISNALKYTPGGEISIYQAEAAEAGKEPAKRLLLVIEDTGIGIAAEDLPRIFEKGYTGLNGRADKRSTGIGLYLCKRILDKLNIRIWVESRLGKGTKVYLELEK